MTEAVGPVSRPDTAEPSRRVSMSLSRKSRLLSWFLAVALAPAALAASPREATPEGSAGVVVVQTRPDSFQQPLAADQATPEEQESACVEEAGAEDESANGRASFCGPGEKVKCSLGPPPKCWCE
jgi:hypothetical protein